MTDLIVKNLSVSVADASLVRDASFSLSKGELVCVLGPNGAGKTSLLRGALGLIASSGSVTINDRPLSDLSITERARVMSYLPQSRPLAWPNKVRDIVALGRYAYGGRLGRLNDKDAKAVDAAIEACDIANLSNRRADTLSGGEAARMHLARAFSARSPLLIADEPVAALDPHHQFRVMDLIRSYVGKGHGALVILHDLNLAARYADRLIWMKDGLITAAGSVEETMTAQRLADIFGINAVIENGQIRIEGVAQSHDAP